jgi:hypothetical protein
MDDYLEEKVPGVRLYVYLYLYDIYIYTSKLYLFAQIALNKYTEAKPLPEVWKLLDLVRNIARISPKRVQVGTKTPTL